MPHEPKGHISKQAMLLACCYGAAVSLGLSIFLMLLCSLFVAQAVFPLERVPLLCLMILALSSLVGGRFAIRKGRGMPLVLASGTGLLLCAIIVILGLFSPEMTWNAQSVRILLVVFFGASLASLGGRGRQKRKKHHG